MTTLSEKFKATLGQPIEIAGGQAIQIWTKQMTISPCAIDLTWLGTSSKAKQGIRVNMVSGKLEINGQRFPEAILWEDTSPKIVRMVCFGSRRTVIKIWNVWDVDGLVQAWVGNSGMMVNMEGIQVLFNCSDGVGEPRFDNLQFSLHWGR